MFFKIILCVLYLIAQKGIIFASMQQTTKHEDMASIAASVLILNHGKILNRHVDRILQTFYFPASYKKTWDKIELNSIGKKTQAILKEYDSGRFALHWRHFTNSEVLTNFCESDEPKSIHDVLTILTTIRTELFNTKYSKDLYGYVDFKPSAFSKIPSLTLASGQYKQVRATPGSLYARCRFILLKTIELLSQKTGTTFLTYDQKISLAENVDYYLLNHKIDQNKKSTSLVIKAVRLSLAATALASIVHLGPVVGLFSLDPIGHTLDHYVKHLVLEKAVHGIYHQTLHKVESH